MVLSGYVAKRYSPKGDENLLKTSKSFPSLVVDKRYSQKGTRTRQFRVSVPSLPVDKRYSPKGDDNDLCIQSVDGISEW